MISVVLHKYFPFNTSLNHAQDKLDEVTKQLPCQYVMHDQHFHKSYLEKHKKEKKSYIQYSNVEQL